MSGFEGGRTVGQIFGEHRALHFEAFPRVGQQRIWSLDASILADKHLVNVPHAVVERILFSGCLPTFRPGLRFFWRVTEKFSLTAR